MNQKNVLEILNIFSEINAPVWLAGGWAVDALVGNQTRPHLDVDLAFDNANEDKIITKFKLLGYSIIDDARPTRFVLKNKDGSEIDMHPVVFNKNRSGEQLVPGGKSFHYPKNCFSEGLINGHKVPCLTADQLVTFHLGYKPLEKDRHNMQILHEFLGIPLPTIYT